MARQMR